MAVSRNSQSASWEREPRESDAGWPTWAKRIVSAILAIHIAAIMAGAFGAQPSSVLQQRWNSAFFKYFQLTDQGYSYRYYSPEPPPTPVAEATLTFQDGRTERIRIPDRSARPRLLYQRQLALSHALEADHRAAQQSMAGPQTSVLSKAMAKHLFRKYDCERIAFDVRMHFAPPLDRVREGLEGPRSRRIDPEADEFYSPRERIAQFTRADLGL